MANRPRKRLDAPALFEDLDLEDPQEGADLDEKSGLDQLVTKVSSRPKSWAMKWRPDETRAVDAAEVDRHPARSAGCGVETPRDSEQDSTVTDDFVVEVNDAAEDVVAEVIGEVEVNDADDADESSATSEPVLTSRTWDARSDAGARHPQMPSATPPPAPVPSVRTSATPMRTAPVARPRSPFARAGWPLAILLVIAWIGTSVFGPTPNDTPVTEPPTHTTPEAEAPILARPTEAEMIEAELFRSELASMRDERARLMREVDAAYVLLQDHRRLSRELQDSMATNKGASIEVDGLAEDLKRWQRRHAVALERLDEMDEELLRSDEQIDALAAERDALRRRLDALEGTD